MAKRDELQQAPKGKTGRETVSALAKRRIVDNGVRPFNVRSIEDPTKRKKEFAKTRLAEYERRGIRHFLYYYLFLGTAKRRAIFLTILSVLLLSIATVLVYLVG